MHSILYFIHLCFHIWGDGGQFSQQDVGTIVHTYFSIDVQASFRKLIWCEMSSNAYILFILFFVELLDSWVNIALTRHWMISDIKRTFLKHCLKKVRCTLTHWASWLKFLILLVTEHKTILWIVTPKMAKLLVPVIVMSLCKTKKDIPCWLIFLLSNQKS